MISFTPSILTSTDSSWCSSRPWSLIRGPPGALSMLKEVLYKSTLKAEVLLGKFRPQEHKRAVTGLG